MVQEQFKLYKIHNDIISPQEKIVDKSSITLGVHTDGLIYLFVNNLPVGNGVEIETGSDIYGYVDSQNNIVLKGNLDEGTYTVAYEMDDGSTINIGNMMLDTNVYYSITSNLTNCTLSNNTTQIVHGESYFGTIIADEGCELSTVVVTMNGVDISTSSVSDSDISIASVTGDIIITAKAEATSTTEKTNFCVVDGDGWITGGRCGSNGTSREDSPSFNLTNYIEVKNGDVIYVKNFDIATTTYSGIYDSNKAAISGFMMTADSGAGYVKNIDLSGDVEQFTVDNENAGYIRICGKNTLTSADIIINIQRSGIWL